MGRNPEVGYRSLIQAYSNSPAREYERGFEECKRRVVEILKKNLSNPKCTWHDVVDVVKEIKEL